MKTAQVETIDAESANQFRNDPKLPAPSPRFLAPLGLSASDLLSNPFVDYHILAVAKRLSEDPAVDNQILIDNLAYALFGDDPFYTAYNTLVLLGHFAANGTARLMDPIDFAGAVAGLSHNNGERGSESMHRLYDSKEIAGALAVLIFIGTMDRDKLVKLSLLKHPESDGGKYGLTISNRYLDQLLRGNPEHFPAVVSFLSHNQITTSKKSVQPLVDYLNSGGSGALITGLL